MRVSGELRPYSYLDARGNEIFGFPEWRRGPSGKEEAFGGEIGPGQEELVRIVTYAKYKNDVKQLAESSGPLTWRVQVRRGLVPTRNGKVSATAVIGVQFTGQEIEKQS
jgi:hypothetical protein